MIALGTALIFLGFAGGPARPATIGDVFVVAAIVLLLALLEDVAGRRWTRR